MPSVDARANRVGRRQRGLATRRQLVDDAGVSSRTIARRLVGGVWTEPLPGVVDLGTHAASWRRSLHAFVLAASPEAYASHQTAAYLHRFLDVARPARHDVLVMRGRCARVGGLPLHTTLTLGADEVTVVDGIPCTSRARTLCDLAAVWSPRQLELVVLDQVRGRRGLLAEVVELTTRRDRAPGRRRLLDLCARLPADGALLASPLEVRGVLGLTRLDLCPPCLQYDVRDRDGSIIKRVDGAWPTPMVIVEFDGAAYHDLSYQREQDVAVRDRMRALGWEIIVARASDLHGDALEALAARLRSALAVGRERARARRGTGAMPSREPAGVI